MADEAGSNLRDWKHPWLRVNVLVRDMARLLGDRDARPVIKIESRTPSVTTAPPALIGTKCATAFSRGSTR